MGKFFWVVFFCFFGFTGSAHPQTYRNLTFEGAGVKGLAYVGAIEALDSLGVLDSIDRVGGTSAGAITALSLALGYSAQEIKTLMYDTDLGAFNDGRFFFVGGIHRTIKQFGWYKGETFMKWLEKLIAAKSGDADITFGGLAAKGFKDLTVTGVSLNRQKLLVFSKDSYPNMKVKDAVRASMSIPLYYRAVYMDSVGNVYKKPPKGLMLDVVVDGGIMANFPIQLYDTLVTYEMGEPPVRLPNYATLGIRIDSDSQVEYDHDRKGLAPIPIDDIQDYMQAMYTLIKESMNRYGLNELDWMRTVSIASGGIGSRVRKLSVAEKDLLIGNGKKAVCSFFESK